MAKFCHNCGSPLEGAPKFCPSCGTPLMEMGAPQQQEMPTPPQEAPTPQEPTMEQPMEPMNAPGQPAPEPPQQEQALPPQQNEQPRTEQPMTSPEQPMTPPSPQQPPVVQQPTIASPPVNGPMPPNPQQRPPFQTMAGPQGQGGAPMPMAGGMQPPMQGQGLQPPQGMQNPMMQRQMPQGMQNPPMQRPMPQSPMMQGPQGQPMMYQNAPGQNFGQQPYGAWPGQGGQNAYGPQAEGAFTLGPLGTDQGLVQMFLRYDGRLNRKPYIFRALALFGVILVISILFAVLGTMMKSTAISMLGSLFSIVAAVPGVMLMIRRLHDLDHPTWWVVGGFIPLVNFALGLYLLCAEGTRGPNQFGPDPLEGQH